jgi:hypothetical protein
LSDLLFPNYPDKEHFLHSEQHQDAIDVFGVLNEQQRLDLFRLAEAFYQAGWFDAASEIESRVVDLVYVSFPK